MSYWKTPPRRSYVWLHDAMSGGECLLNHSLRTQGLSLNPCHRGGFQRLAGLKLGGWASCSHKVCTWVYHFGSVSEKAGAQMRPICSRRLFSTPHSCHLSRLHDHHVNQNGWPWWCFPLRLRLNLERFALSKVTFQHFARPLSKERLSWPSDSYLVLTLLLFDQDTHQLLGSPLCCGIACREPGNFLPLFHCSWASFSAVLGSSSPRRPCRPYCLRQSAQYVVLCSLTWGT